MRKIIIVAFLIAVASSCKDKNEKTKVDISSSKPSDTIKKFNFQILNDSLPPSNGMVAEAPFSLEGLGLPPNFVERRFINDASRFQDDITQLMGCVLKQTIVGGKFDYEKTLDAKKTKDSTIITIKFPTDGILFQKGYDSNSNANVKFLMAGASIERDKASKVIINDITTASIDYKSLNLKAIYDTYHEDKEVANYSVVTGARVTAVVFSNFERISARGDYTSAIKVGASYYKENSALYKDVKISITTTKVSELIKIYVKGKNS